MNQPGNREITTAELSDLIRAELSCTLPLDGGNTVTLHCQVDAIGPSERHPDLVKVELSFPPEKCPEPVDAATPHGAPRCPTCGPTTAEEHPRNARVLRCVNCKERLSLVSSSRWD
ncbi:hypothetical protein KVH27_35140 [Streptomyces olivaceus]|uniref:hypothetical protein n=1 Tax=Streptomyces olivaceus TaxID=47716 RepID=UPI001CCF404D|nr:hypothetical protein [Streptomyces olivaceus]MBZ6253588.1 hypothetical protein [Streptomyces olivaceus]